MSILSEIPGVFGIIPETNRSAGAMLEHPPARSNDARRSFDMAEHTPSIPHAEKKKRVRGPLADRLWSRVDRRGPDECWPWQGATNKKGYGALWNGVDKNVGAHVAAYELTFGPIPDGMDACHTCDNPSCCNPAHIFPGTRRDNMQDCAAKGRNGSQRHPERRPRGDQHWARTSPERLARGERANAGKGVLTVDQVMEIRRIYAAGGISQAALGRKFGVSQTQIGKIVRGERWSWLADEGTAKAVSV